MKIENLKFRAKRSLGQNFLINPGILKKIITAGDLKKDDVVLEVGPGTGNLTELISPEVKKVIAVEKDHRLIYLLKEKFTENGNIEFREGDILQFKPENNSLKENGYKIIANIPYYITSNFIKKIFEEWPKPKLIILTIQKEVAKRIVTQAPSNILGLSVQYYAEPEIISYVSAGSFQPAPKVDSAIIRLSPRENNLKKEEKDNFFKVIRAGFQGKRKLLISNLIKNLSLNREILEEYFSKTGIDIKSRPENLSLGTWIELTGLISKT